MTSRKKKKSLGSIVSISASEGAPSWRFVAAIVAILLVYVALRLPGISVPLDRDEGAFGYMGQLIRDGKLPYRDGFDHKPPVAFYINALALFFVPPTERGIHIFLLLYNLVTLICVFYLGKSLFRSFSAGLWCSFAYAVFSASPAIQGFTASTEMWMLLPIVLSLLLAVVGTGKRSFFLLFMSGVSGAAACWTKPTAFTSILFVFLFVGLTVLRCNPDHDESPAPASLKALGSWISGGVVFSGLLVLYFALHGILGEFLYWTFQHNVAYAEQLTLRNTMGLIWPRLVEIIRGNFLIIGVGLISAVRLLIKRQPGGVFMLAFLALSFLGTIPGFAYRHYFVQLAPAVAVAAGFGLFTIVEHFRKGPIQLSALFACALSIQIVPIAINSDYFLERDPDRICRVYFQGNPFPESKSIAAFVAEQTTPADPVFVWGSEPQILFYAERQSPSPSLMVYPMTADYPRYKEFQRKVWNALQQNPPKIVLDVLNIGSSIMWDGKASLEILDRLDKVWRKDYEVIGIMVVAGPHSGWLAGGGQLPQNVPCIYVFKKK